MTDLAEARPKQPHHHGDRCDACGQPLETLDDGCCPLCGHRLASPDVTSEDHTPYALARAEGKPGWRAMCRWVYGAGKHRLAFLSLSRPSAASRSFARINILLFAAAVALTVFASSGWFEVRRGPGLLATTAAPTGRGWWHVLTRPVHPPDRFARILETDLWWNFPRAVLTAAGALLVTTIVGLLLVRIIGAGSGRAAQGPSSATPRLRCAVEYSTAWLLMLALAVLVAGLRPLAQISTVGAWEIKLSATLFEVPAVLIGLAGVLLWWFWLIRLGQRTPKETCGAVSRYFLIWTPLWVVVFAGGAVYGVFAGAQRLAERLNLMW